MKQFDAFEKKFNTVSLKKQLKLFKLKMFAAPTKIAPRNPII